MSIRWRIDGIAAMRADTKEMKQEPDMVFDRLEELQDLAAFVTSTVVHVDSGALNASVQSHTRRSPTRAEWEGRITVADEAAVDYAVYERARKGHDFTTHWQGIEHEMERVMFGNAAGVDFSPDDTRHK